MSKRQNNIALPDGIEPPATPRSTPVSIETPTTKPASKTKRSRRKTAGVEPTIPPSGLMTFGHLSEQNTMADIVADVMSQTAPQMKPESKPILERTPAINTKLPDVPDVPSVEVTKPDLSMTGLTESECHPALGLPTDCPCSSPRMLDAIATVTAQIQNDPQAKAQNNLQPVSFDLDGILSGEPKATIKQPSAPVAVPDAFSVAAPASADLDASAKLRAPVRIKSREERLRQETTLQAPPQARSIAPPQTIIETAKKVLGCTDESCVVAHPAMSGAISDVEIEARFKPSGPRNTLRLTSNFNLDETLWQWAAEFPTFFPYPFTPIDFYETRSELVQWSLPDVLIGRIPTQIAADKKIGRKNTTAACIINTGASNTAGKHWVCVFVDCRHNQPHRPWTVEYWNSAGNPPPPNVITWLEEARQSLITFRGNQNVETKWITKVRHQEKDTECGLYVLLYIRLRLRDVSAASFLRKPIGDDEVAALRKMVFRST
jgi:hypothetical protein